MEQYERVKIAIIDSGISNHEKIDIDRIKYTKNIKEDGIDDNVEDLSGHGTAIASILCSRLKCNLYILKILDKNKEATTDQLIKALEIAISINVDIINLSLGTQDFSRYDEIKSLCDLAEQKGIFIVCASNNKNQSSLPYDLDNVLKVKPYLSIKNNDVFYNDGIFIAKGMPSMLPWLDGKYALMGGSSFAAPYVTLKLAEIKSKFREDYLNTKKYLINDCRKIETIKDFYPIDSLKEEKYIKNIDLYNNISSALEEVLGEIDEGVSLLKQGINNINSYRCLNIIGKKIGFELKYDEFCLEDFLYKKNLANKIDLIMKDSEKISIRSEKL